MKKSGVLLAALLAAAGCCAAGEEYMPLVPGAFSPVEFDGDGNQLRRISSADADVRAGGAKRPALRKNIVRLTVPSLGKQPESKMRMMEAAPAGPDGTLRFRPASSTASMPGSHQADIPGLVPPELLAVSRMEESGEPRRRVAGFSPIRLPGALGTEELPEFDPYSVQRTGNPFKDAPGEAEAFPAAATGGQTRLWEVDFPSPENNALRPPKTVPRVTPPPPGAVSGLRPPAPSGSSLRPASSGSGVRPPAAPIAVAKQRTAPVTVVKAVIPAVAAPVMPTMPPLPELPVRMYSGGSGQTRKTEVVSLPPPLPERKEQTVNRAMGRAGEYSLLNPSSRTVAASGLKLAMPPMALSEGDGVPALSADEFTPMRGMRVY